MQSNTAEKSIQVSALEKQSVKHENQGTSDSLSKDLALQLLNLMKSVTAKEVNPNTVNAACNCASEIHKILKLNFQMKQWDRA